MPGIASAATSVLIGHVAGATSMRVGSGGIMLPNHAPLVIAEQFGTLARFFPAASISALAARLAQTSLRCGPCAARRAADTFPQTFSSCRRSSRRGPGQRIQAVPGPGTQVPLWILGSSTSAHMLAAEWDCLSLRLAFRAGLLIQALNIYRDRFQPSEQLDALRHGRGQRLAAETDAQAERLATTQQMAFANIFRGARA